MDSREALGAHVSEAPGRRMHCFVRLESRLDTKEGVAIAWADYSGRLEDNSSAGSAASGEDHGTCGTLQAAAEPRVVSHVASSCEKRLVKEEYP